MTMSPVLKWYVAAGVAVCLLALAGGWYALRGTSGESMGKNATSTGSVQDVIARMVETGATSSRGDGFTVELESGSDAPPVPSLNRSIPWTADLDAQGRTVAIGRINDAIAALKENPQSYEKWIELGQLRMIVKDYEGAKEAWEYAALLGPGTVTPFQNLGDLHMSYLKDYPKAESALKTALANDPKNPLRYSMLFELYAKWKPNSPEAVDTLEEGIEKFPNALDLYVLLARHYRATGRSADARVAFDAAIAAATKAGNTEAVNQLKAEKAALQ